MDYVFIDKSIEPLLSKFAERTTFAIDLETTGLNPIDSRILLCQIGFDDEIFVIDVSKVRLEPILPYLESNKWLKLIQNAKFEGKFFQHFYKVEISNVFDTQLAELIITSDQRAKSNLEFLAKKYANVTLDKTIRQTFHGIRPMAAFSEEQLKYAAADVEVLFPIYEAQKKTISEYGEEKIAQIEFDLANVVASMENEGIPIDIPLWKAILAKRAEEHEESRLRMHEIIFDDGNQSEQLGMFARDGINLNSPQQLKKKLADLGIDIDSTNEREIALLDHPVAKELLVYRGLQKIISSYGEGLLANIHPFSNRLHPDFQQIGTETGRFSCRKPNVQQIPSEFRECIGLADHKIIAADYSQMELRILAELSKEPLLIEAFQSGQDLHKTTASIMFNMPIEKVTKEQRFVAKTLNFGITYGMGPDKLLDMLNTEASKGGWKEYTRIQAENLLKQYKNTYKVATAWLRSAGEAAYAQGYAKTLMDRRRNFVRPFGLSEDEMRKEVSAIKRQGANSPVQGSNADITKLAMLNLHADLKNYGFRAKIINQVHDEIVVLAHNSQAEAVKEMVRDSMVESAQEVLKVVPVKVDVTVSDYWKKG